MEIKEIYDIISTMNMMNLSDKSIDFLNGYYFALMKFEELLENKMEQINE